MIQNERWYREADDATPEQLERYYRNFVRTLAQLREIIWIDLVKATEERFFYSEEEKVYPDTEYLFSQYSPEEHLEEVEKSSKAYSELMRFYRTMIAFSSPSFHSEREASRGWQLLVAAVEELVSMQVIDAAWMQGGIRRWPAKIRQERGS